MKGRIETKQMATGIISFLSISVIVLVIVLAIATTKHTKISKEFDAEFTQKQNKISALIEDKRILILDKITLAEKCRELYNDNVKLSDAVRELREINKALTAEPEVTATDTDVGHKSLLPKGHTNTFRCEPYMVKDEENSTDDEIIYKSAFHPNSDQYRLQQECITHKATGIRYYTDDKGSYFCVALAGAYGIEIGHAYKVKLRCGTEFNVIMGDFKHPIDNVRLDDYGDPDVNYDGQPATSIIEFIVDMDAIPEAVRQAGTMSALNEFGGLYGDGGDIVEIKDTGGVWKW